MVEVEYRVRPVVRYMVTRFKSHGDCAGVAGMGEFDNEELAEHVRDCLLKADADVYENIQGEGSPYVLVYRGFNIECLPVLYAHSYAEAMDRQTKELEAGNDYRLYRRY